MNASCFNVKVILAAFSPEVCSVKLIYLLPGLVACSFIQSVLFIQTPCIHSPVSVSVSSGGISGERQPGSSAGGARCAAALGQRERRRAVLAETTGPTAAGLSGPGERPTEPRAGGPESSAAAAGTRVSSKCSGQDVCFLSPQNLTDLSDGPLTVPRGQTKQRSRIVVTAFFLSCYK